MHCIYLISTGEIIQDARFIFEMGYSIDLYPSTQDTSQLLDTRYDESATYIGRPPESCERAHVRSLRASFMRMITDTRFESHDDSLIFCESDALPCIPARDVAPLIEQLLDTHPEADVIRLYHTAQIRDEVSQRTLPADVHFFPLVADAQRDANTPAVWGTRALIIPKRSRAKVARLFAEYRLPIDITLEAAQGKGELSILTCSSNLFVQRRRTQRPSPYNIALLLSSYKRYTDLQRQIWCIMDQDTPHPYHLFVAAKGIPESLFHSHLYPQFAHFIEQGRLTLRHYPNKNQLSNLLDTIRDLDITPYDLFAKLDDDDLYSRRYLSSLQSYHQHLPRDLGSYYSGCGYYLQSIEGFPRYMQAGYFCHGPTITMPPQVLQHLLTLEAQSGSTPQLGITIAGQYFSHGHGFTEDKLIDHINRAEHACNRATYIDMLGYHDSFCISQNAPSVMRGNYLARDFQQQNSHINTDPHKHEIILEAIHPQWGGLLRLFQNQVCHLNTQSTGELLHYDGTQLTVQWHHWGKEQFVKRDDGIFQLVPPENFPAQTLSDQHHTTPTQQTT